jgi:threonine/homoserine/homoserine lactone efflux protein
MNILLPLLGFTAAATMLTLTPGVDTAMVLRSAATGGPRHGIAAASGICLGLLIWGLGAASGLSLLLTASHTGFLLLKFCGAAYLLWLGANMWRHKPAAPASAPEEQKISGTLAAFRRGFTSNMLNPKVGVFYITFLPQFIPAHVFVPAYAMLLTAINLGLDILWFAALIALTVPLARTLARPAVRRALDRVTGTTLIGFGIRLGLTH